MSWLVDDPSTVYLILGAAAIVLGVFWWTTRKRAYALGVGGVAALIALVWLLSHFIQTDAKRIHQTLLALAHAVEVKDADGVFADVSPKFQRQNMDKAAYRAHVQPLIRAGYVQKITIWDYEAREISRERRAALVTFKVKTQSDVANYPFFNCRATFALDSDDKWRLSGFELFSPQVDPMSKQGLDTLGY